jgi:predicted nucleic acid-binding protein
MTSYFLDSSAVVRLYTAEIGSRTVANMLRSARAQPPTAQVLVCDLSLPETVSALLQIAQDAHGPKRGLSRAALKHVLPQVRADFDGAAPLSLVPATGCMELAADLVEKHRLQVADAVLVAAALRTQRVVPEAASFVFVSDDLAQCRAAEAEGLYVLRTAA